jgi:fructoselysine-6-P-deglycase FrlB-like protein
VAVAVEQNHLKLLELVEPEAVVMVLRQHPEEMELLIQVAVEVVAVKLQVLLLAQAALALSSLKYLTT